MCLHEGGAGYSVCVCVCVNFVVNAKGVGSELHQWSDTESCHGVIYFSGAAEGK